MKFKLKKLLFLLGITTFIVVACDEEEKGPLFTDDTAPNQVSEVVSEPTSGGARISYKLPTDEDLLFVLAEYKLPSGEIASAKSSTFNNSLEIFGLLDSINTHQVKLFTEDRGGNKSEPITIDVSIKEAPVYKAANSVRVIPDFGGVRTFWTGVDGVRLTLRLLTAAEDNLPIAIETLVSQTAIEDFSVTRGFSSDLRTFTAEVSDRWGNKAEPIVVELEPLFEVSLPKEDFASHELPHDFTNDVTRPNLNLTKMWNNAEIVLGAFEWRTPIQNVSDPNPLPEYDPNLGNPISHLVTIDLGRSVKLSRFKYWQGPFFDFATINTFDLWGTNETPNAEGTLDGWTKILSKAKVIKPSGLPIKKTDQSDLDRYFAGSEFLIPLDTPRVRYLRFGLLTNYIGTVVFNGQEFEFFGQFDE